MSKIKGKRLMMMMREYFENNSACTSITVDIRSYFYTQVCIGPSLLQVYHIVY